MTMQQKDFAKKKSLELFGVSEFGREKVSLMHARTHAHTYTHTTEP
jgi:hypothetical protein